MDILPAKYPDPYLLRVPVTIIPGYGDGDDGPSEPDGVPENAILFNGEPLMYNGEYLTYN